MQVDIKPPGPLRTFLRGKRNYIQGTQLISRCAELFGDPTATLIDAAFTEITEKEVIACPPEVAANWNFPTVGRVSLSVAGERHQLALLKTQRTVERLERDMGITYEVTPGDEPFEGSATFSTIVDFEGMLNVIVQVVKSLHVSTEPDATDIWFTGIRKLPLPTEWSDQMAEGVLRVKCLRKMDVGPVVQTMLDVALDFKGRAPGLSGMVTFAFNLPENN